MSDKHWLPPTLGPTEVAFDMVDDNEYAILHAAAFREVMRERDALRAEIERLNRLVRPKDG